MTGWAARARGGGGREHCRPAPAGCAPHTSQKQHHAKHTGGGGLALSNTRGGSPAVVHKRSNNDLQSRHTWAGLPATGINSPHHYTAACTLAYALNVQTAAHVKKRMTWASPLQRHAPDCKTLRTANLLHGRHPNP